VVEAPDLDFGPRASKPASPTVMGYGSASPLDDFSEVLDPGQPAAVDVWEGAPRASNSRPPAGEVQTARRAPAPPAAPAAPPAAAAPARKPPSVPPGVGGRVIDDPFEDGGGGGDLKLELDIAKASVPPKAPAPVAAASLHPAAGPPVGVPSSHHPPAPGAVESTQRGVEDEILRQQASALGAYGDPPRHLWEAPMYAYRVYKRQGELRRELAARRNEAQQAATQLEDALVAFGERVRGVAESMPFYIRTFDPIRALEAQIRSLDGVAAAEMDQHRARMKEVGAKVTQAEQALSQLQLEERRLAEDLAQAEAAMQRAQAKLKRAEIEMRNQVGPGPQGPASRRG
jgi:hypothetical protein